MRRLRFMVTLFLAVLGCGSPDAAEHVDGERNVSSLVAKGVTVQVSWDDKNITATGDEMRLADDGKHAVLIGNVRVETDEPLSFEVSGSRLSLDFSAHEFELSGQVASRFEMPGEWVR